MKTTTLRILLIVLVAALALAMAGCKSESSPTAPPATGTVPPSGGVTPPTGATVVLTVSNPAPLVSSPVTVTATVTDNGQPVADGTAVQFTTTIGTFSDTGTKTTIRTTTNGVAKAVFTSTSAGTATLTATVNNVSKTTTVTFTTEPTKPPPPNTTPTISSVCVQTSATICTTPATGTPAGGQTVVITGTNFRAPVRVLFDPGNGQPAKEAFVQSVTATQIVVTAPPFEIITGQTLPVTITVFDEAGTVNEQKVSAAAAFTYQLAVLTPLIRSLEPTSGPIDGGTRVAIFGDAFQSPVQVFFGSAEAQQLKVTFNEIDVMSPTARDTAPNASGPVTGPVSVTVRNVASGKDTTFNNGFRYIAKMQITAAGPTTGPTTGGTRVTIDGVGFNDPITVSIGGVAAQPIKVSGTQIVAITAVPLLTSCANVTGPISVSNIDNGDTAIGPSFTYQIVKPQIVNIGANAALNGTTTVTVANAIGIPRILIGTAVALITGTITNPDGTTTFTVQVPPSLKLDPQTCPQGGTTLIPTAFDVTYTSLSTSCTDTLPKGLIINPAPGPVLTVSGNFTPFTGKITPGQVGPPATPTTVSVSPSSETVTIINTGNTNNGQQLNIASISTASAGGVNGCNAFNVSATPPAPVSLGQCDSFAISASYKGQITPTTSPDQCTITVNGTLGTTPFTRQFTVSGSTQ